MKLNTEKLPSSWCVKCDGSERFKEVMRAIDTSIYHPENSPLYSHRRSYYGIHDGVMHFSITKPFGTVLTLDELCELVGWEDQKNASKSENWQKLEISLYKCPTCNAPVKMTWSGLDLVSEAGDETLASRHYHYDIGDMNPLEWVSDEEINSWIDKVNEVEFDERPVTTKEIAVWYAKCMRQRMAEELERRMK